jgi:hypothetical protein
MIHAHVEVEKNTKSAVGNNEGVQRDGSHGPR